MGRSLVDRELASARQDLAKAKAGVERTAKEKFESFLEKAKKKRMP